MPALEPSEPKTLGQRYQQNDLQDSSVESKVSAGLGYQEGAGRLVELMQSSGCSSTSSSRKSNNFSLRLFQVLVAFQAG